jgi:hypothetical protein
MDQNTILAFNSIACFVKDLNEAFGNKNKSVALYNRLLEKTTLQDTEAINRHITQFKQLFNNNPNYFSTFELISPNITYSERVYINLSNVLNLANQTEKDVINKHLECIYGFIFGGKPVNVTQPVTQPVNLTPENKFMQTICENVKDTIENSDTKNPMEILNGLNSSGFMNNMMQNLQSGTENGELNIDSLMGMVSGMLKQAGPEGEKMESTVNGLMTDLKNGKQPDMSKIMGMMAGMMPTNGAGDDGSKVEELD